jgi:lysophospholipase L1-like esterase
MQVCYKKQILFGLLLSMIIIFSVEGILRIYDYYFPACSFYDSEVFADFSSDLRRKICYDNTKTVWNDNPLRLIPMQNLEITHINSDGFRGDEVKNLPSYRIFLVGGSTMYGVGASSDETTIPGYLGKMISQNYENIEIINAGIPRNYSVSEIEYIKNDLIHYKPNMIIVYDGWNDLEKNFNEFNTTKENDLNEFIRFIHRAEYHTPKIILHHYFNWKHETYDLKFDSKHIEEKSSLWAENWKDTCESLNEEGIKIVIILQPILGSGDKILSSEEEEYFSHYDSGTANKFYEKYAKKMQSLKNSCYQVHDYRNVFDGYTDTIYFDSGHMSDAGNKIIADKIYEVILPIITQDLKNNTNP